MLVEEGLEAPEHDAVRKEIVGGSETGEYARNEGDEGDTDVVHRNAEEHLGAVPIGIYCHGGATAYVVERHVDIVVAEDDAAEFRISQL